MSGTGKTVPLHEVERLIKQLENPVRSAKTRAARNLEGVPVFPSLISSADQFLHEVVTPILVHFSSDTEQVRQSCVNIIDSYVDQLGPSNLHETLNYILPPLFDRLKSEEIEPAEEIRLSLMNLLLKLVKSVTKETIPDHIDAKRCIDMATPLCIAFKTQNADMKKVACSVLNAVMDRCTEEALAEVAPQLITALIPNCVHRHNEVRKVTIQTLARLYSTSSVTDDIEKVSDLLQRLTDDNNAAVRKSVIAFCEMLLTVHKERVKMYFPMIIPLLAFAMPLVPVRKVDIEVEPVQEKMNDEPKMAFDAMTHIGKVYESDTSMTDVESSNMFDNERVICAGLEQIIKENYGKLLDKLLPMVVDWTDQCKKYGFAALRTAVHLGKSLATTHIPQIFLKMSQSLHDQRNDEQNALQVAAIVSSFVDGKEIVDFLLPKVKTDGPKDIVQLLSVVMTNSQVNDDVLLQILNHFMTVKVYKDFDCIEPLVQLLLAILTRSIDFANANATSVLIFILKLCEKTDALKCFVNSFGRPIADVFAENMDALLRSSEKTPEYMTHLLLTSPVEAVSANQNIACEAIMQCLEGDHEAKHKTEKLILELANRKAFHHISAEFVDKVIDDMVWSPGKEKVPYREAATLAMASMIHNEVIDDEMLTNDIDKILPVILSSYDDTWADCVRIAGTQAMAEFIARSTNCDQQFDKIYPAIKERLDDHMLDIRIQSAAILAAYFVKCTGNEAIPSKWNEIIIFIDDDAEGMRNAIASFCRVVSKVPQWKDDIVKTLSEQQNFHPESNELCKSLVAELQ